MRTRTAMLAAVALAMIVAVVAGSMAASKQYQFTGSVVAVDAKGKTISVDKGGDIWEFSTDGLKDLKLKKGDRVTVFYQMAAKKIEVK